MKTTSNNTEETMNMSSDRITSTVIMVTAEIAQRWLTRNKKNRQLADTTMNRYRSEMSNGLWQFAADPIRFDVDGNLIDGQHRLTALAGLPDATIPMLVVRGLPADTQMVMDQGQKRTPGQQLQLMGTKNGHNVASAVKVFLIWDQGLMFKDRRKTSVITSAVVQDFVKQNPEQIEFLQSMMYYVKRIDVPPSIVGAFVIGGHNFDAELTRAFLQSLEEMSGVEKGNPIHTLDRRIRTIRRKRENVNDRDYIALFTQAFNAWKDGRTMTQLLRPKGGFWSEDNFPRLGH